MDKKIACCISGLPNSQILEHLKYIEKYKNQMDFFVFFWDVISIQLKQSISNMLHPKEIKYVPQIQFPFDAKFKEPDKHENKNNALSMFYGISQVQAMRKQYEQRTGVKYDVIIRFRYDIHLFDDWNQVMRNVLRCVNDDTIVFPWEHHHIGICDQLWFGKSTTMDKFVGLFEWIKRNIDVLFFVNENLMYKFIISNNINFKCVDIKYVLRRGHLLGSTDNKIYEEYIRQSTLPWIVSCPEKSDTYYNTFIFNKNDTANNVYFLTNAAYCDIPCVLFNKTSGKFVHILENIRCEQYVFVGHVICTHFRIHPVNAFSVNIFVDNPLLTHGKTLCISVKNGKLTCTQDMSNRCSQFFMIKKGEYYQFSQYGTSSDLQPFRSYICIDSLNNICVNGEKCSETSYWNLQM